MKITSQAIDSQHMDLQKVSKSTPINTAGNEFIRTRILKLRHSFLRHASAVAACLAILLLIAPAMLAANWQSFYIGVPVGRAPHSFQLRLGATSHGMVTNLGVFDRLGGIPVNPRTVLSVTFDLDASRLFTLADLSAGDASPLAISYGDYWTPAGTRTGWHPGDITESMFVVPDGDPAVRSFLIPEWRRFDPLVVVQPGGVVFPLTIASESGLPFENSSTFSTYVVYRGTANFDSAQPFWIVDLATHEHAGIGTTNLTSRLWFPIEYELIVRPPSGIPIYGPGGYVYRRDYLHLDASPIGRTRLPWYFQDITTPVSNPEPVDPGLPIVVQPLDPGEPPTGDLYVLPGGAGAKDGRDWGNALARIPEAPPRGATIWLGDGEYEAYTGRTPADETKSITIIKATPAAHGTDLGWSPDFGDGIAQFPGIYLLTDRWVFDGAKRDSLQTGHGIKIVDSTTDNATLIWLDNEHTGRKHITLRHVELMGDPALAIRTNGFYATGYGGQDGTGPFTFYRCSFHDLWGVPVASDQTKGLIFDECWMANTRNTNIPVWPAKEAWHTEGFQLRRSSDIEIRYSVFKDIDGTAIIRDGGSGAAVNWNIHHNVFDMRGDQIVGHILSFNSNASDSNNGVRFTDNTTFGQHGQGSAGFSWGTPIGPVVLKGNVWYDCTWVPFGYTHLITERGYNYMASTNMPFSNGPMAPTEGTYSTHYDAISPGLHSDDTPFPFADPDFANSGNYTLTPEVQALIKYP